MAVIGRLYKCDVCGKEGKWTKNWRHKEIHHKTWDETITVCSKKCKEVYNGST